MARRGAIYDPKRYPRFASFQGGFLHRGIFKAGDMNGGSMKFKVIDTGAAFVVAYSNHRGEFIAVVECGTLTAAQSEAERMNAEQQAPRPPSHGNRYLRQFI